MGTFKKADVLFPLGVFAGTWVLLWGWMRLVRLLLPLDLAPDAVLRPYLGISPESNVWLEVWQRWDVLHYQAIAEKGYQAFETSLFTPPLYPWLMRISGNLLNNTLLGGLLVSVIFCAAAFLGFYQLAQVELKEQAAARKAVFLFAIFPTSFFLFAPYTESLFMLGSALSLLAIRKNNWLAVGLWGALAASSRLTGAVIALPVAWYAWQAWKQNKDLKPWLAFFMVSFAALLFPLYAQVGLGSSWLAPFEAQSQRFHGGFTFPGFNILKSFQQIFAGQYVLPNTVDLFFTLLFIWLSILVWQRLPRIYGIYVLGFMLLYLTRIADVYPLLSMARYVLALYPAFLLLPTLTQNPISHRIWVYTSIAGSLFLSAQFALWGWVG